PKQTARILAPNDQLCDQEAHRLVLIRPNKVHLISTGEVYKINLSKESYFTPSTSPPWARPKSSPRTSEIRLYTCTRLEWVTKPWASSLVRRRQLLVRLFVNGSNTKQLSIALGLGLHARYPLVRYRRSSERCRITPELHRGSL